MDYIDALLYINGLAQSEPHGEPDLARRALGPARMARLCSGLGDPQKALRTVHVAGTKGKGSTAAMIHNTLVAGGIKAGLYTSPHLHTLLERIRLNRRLVSEEEVAEQAEVVIPAVERLHAEAAELGKVTAFELITALALRLYAEKGVQVAVLETGMGGRLDATSVADGKVAVITPVSYDHTRLLGHTLAAIAGEKAGIVKEGAILVSPPQAAEVVPVLEEACRARGAQLRLGGRDWHWQEERSADGRALLRVDGGPWIYLGPRPALLGRHQLLNGGAAVVALHALREQGLALPEEAIAAGLSSVRWPGRLETVAKRPAVVLDGAHNEDSARRLREALGEAFTYGKLILVLGASADKDIAAIVRELAPLADKVVVTCSSHQRAAPVATLVEHCRAVGVEPATAADAGAALALARAEAGPEDLICVTGSLYLVAEAREACGLESVS